MGSVIEVFALPSLPGPMLRPSGTDENPKTTRARSSVEKAPFSAEFVGTPRAFSFLCSGGALWGYP